MSTTDIFQQLPDFYYSKEECQQHKRNKKQTNNRYTNFKQTHFTAGDIQQFNEYRNDEISFNENFCIDDDIIHNNIWNDYISKLPVWEKFQNLNKNSVSNTFNYIFNKFKKGIFIQIKNNELKVFLPFSKVNFINEWSDKISIQKNFKNLEDLIKYTQIKQGYKYNKRNVNNFPKTWYANNCLVRYEWPLPEGDSGTVEIRDMFIELCKNRKIPDIEFFVNRRDFPLFTKNSTEAYNLIYGSNQELLSHNYDKYSPLLSMNSKENCSDIPIPTWEDWDRVSSINDGKFFPKACRDFRETFNIPWNQKKSIAVFRGGSTGCGVDIRTNLRLKLCNMSYNGIFYNGKKILDAGITNFNIRPRLLPTRKGNAILSTIILEKLNFGTSNYLSAKEQSEYKYIINIDGHSAAYRLSYELGMSSVVLLVDSPYYLWFRKLLQPYVHYVPVNRKLDNLETQIKWCIDNDIKCEQIAKNAKIFYDTYLSKNSIFDYLQSYLFHLKKSMGTYINFPKSLKFQIKNEIKIISKYWKYNKHLNIKLNDSNRVPLNINTFDLLKGISNVIQQQLYQNYNLNESGINISKQIKKTKSVVVNQASFLNIKNVLAIKKLISTNKDDFNEFIHHAFVGITCLNNLKIFIPNFMYNFGLKINEKVIIMENISGITFFDWLQSKDFNIKDYFWIMIQLALSLHLAQSEFCFMHYDLYPWNIILKIYEKPIEIKYRIKNCKFYSIKTNIVPVIIDYGKSHVVYNNIQYGIVNLYNANKIQDIITIMISSLYLISVKQNINSGFDMTVLIKFSNFLGNSKYTNYKNFETIKEIKFFTKNAKKYSNILSDDKGEITKLTCLDFINYINKNCYNFNNKSMYKITSYYKMSENYKQVFDFIYQTNDKNRIESYKNVFYTLKRCTLYQPENLLNCYYIHNKLKDHILNNYNNYILNFGKKYESENKNITELYTDCLKLLDNIYLPLIKNKQASNFDFDKDKIYSDRKKEIYNEYSLNNIDKIHNILDTMDLISDIDYTSIRNIITYILCFNKNVDISDKDKQFYTKNLDLIINSDEFYTKWYNAHLNTFKIVVRENMEYTVNILQKNYCEDIKDILKKCNNILEKCK